MPGDVADWALPGDDPDGDLLVVEDHSGDTQAQIVGFGGSHDPVGPRGLVAVEPVSRFEDAQRILAKHGIRTRPQAAVSFATSSCRDRT